MEVFVPGRLCILGEHTDWAGEYRKSNSEVAYGMTIVCATNQGLYSRTEKIASNSFIYEQTIGNEIKQFNSIIDKNQLLNEAHEGGYFCYIAGTVASILEHYDLSEKTQINGIKIHNYHTTLPMRKGLSSSAAVCVTIAKCFNEIYNLHMTMSDMMEMAYLGEMHTPSRCGRMDQCVAMGADKIALMEFDCDQCDLRVLSNATPLHFVVADLGASKNTVNILQSLNSCFPTPVDTTQVMMQEYVLRNQDISWRAIRAIETGDIDGLAAAMVDAQRLFDLCAVPVCPSELTAPRLREILHHPDVQACSIAGKGVGSQGDGSVQFLCRTNDDQNKLIDVLDSLGCEAFSLTIPSTDCCPSIHKDRVHKALISTKEINNIDDDQLRTVFQFPSTSPSMLTSVVSSLLSCGIRHIAIASTTPTVYENENEKDDMTTRNEIEIAEQEQFHYHSSTATSGTTTTALTAIVADPCVRTFPQIKRRCYNNSSDTGSSNSSDIFTGRDQRQELFAFLNTTNSSTSTTPDALVDNDALIVVCSQGLSWTTNKNQSLRLREFIAVATSHIRDGRATDSLSPSSSSIVLGMNVRDPILETDKQQQQQQQQQLYQQVVEDEELLFIPSSCSACEGSGATGRQISPRLCVEYFSLALACKQIETTATSTATSTVIPSERSSSKTYRCEIALVTLRFLCDILSEWGMHHHDHDPPTVVQSVKATTLFEFIMKSTLKSSENQSVFGVVLH